MFGRNRFYNNIHNDEYGFDRSSFDGWSFSGLFENQTFSGYYRCYSISMMEGNERSSVNFTGKVILPPSALDKLSRLSISYPMLFELKNTEKHRTTHAGVLEFIAEEGRIYLPLWMMQTLLLEQGDLLSVTSTKLPLGSYVKIRPQHPDFLQITDPKAVLENALRNFSALTKEDIFQINYNEQIYEIEVLDIKPDDGRGSVSVVETDLEVDFAPPVGYSEPEHTKKQDMYNHTKTCGNIERSIRLKEAEIFNFLKSKRDNVFLSAGHKLNGESVENIEDMEISDLKIPEKTDDALPIPLRVPFGTLFFGYKIKPLENNVENDKFNKAFSGEGYTLKNKKKKVTSLNEQVSKNVSTYDVIEID
ncbi:hypothetical protein PORY_002417 [Pneumocystis oryctolagi]|uniref:Uncharacterized protein n=1 Tax=Pneumocystis oryctolagi TaxID=42067 RepID=A0ACB7C9K3_9ASCO|nr:hypothetical protein PORY_002417 [Pneumocystis oryctolagi]